MAAGLTTAHWLTLHGMVTVAAILLYVVTSHVMRQRRNPSAAIAWVLFIVLVPYVALPAYLVFGTRKRPRPRLPAPPVTARLPEVGGWVVRAALALGQPAPAPYSELRIHADGDEAFRALLEVLDGARHTIDLCTFILTADAVGRVVVERLCQKARQGVRVRVLVDGLGRLMAGGADLRPVTEAGGECAVFVPPLTSPLRGRSNLRDHRKLLLVDASRPGARLWTGGRNLANEYFGGTAGHQPWRDLSFDLTGALLQQARELFEADWAFATHRSASVRSPVCDEPQPPGDGAQLIASGPDQADDTVQALLVTAAYAARQRIAMVTPYFVPDADLLRALCLAARRGVDVQLLLPARSNHRLSDIARARALRALTQAGARVWFAPGMLHAKLIVVDEGLALAGSANIDTRSLFLNYELMFAFRRGADVTAFFAWFERERVPASRYHATEPGMLRDIAEGLLLWTAFQL